MGLIKQAVRQWQAWQRRRRGQHMMNITRLQAGIHLWLTCNEVSRRIEELNRLKGEKHSP
jgi:hypothetical protein